MIVAARAIAAGLIKPFEGCHKRVAAMIHAYICPAGYATQGWGIVVKDLNVPPITQQQADEQFDAALPSYILAALKLSPGLAAHPRKLGAVSSFVFNLGAGRYKASTLRRRINDQDWEAAAEEFGKWVLGGGRVLPGLVRRRAAERAVFES
jgi:lysozyme